MAYSTSDKLAVVLACLEGVMAIILFLAEKTPVTVVCLLLLMLALSIYPILHFAKHIGARMVAFSLFAIGTLLFGWYVWPHNHSALAQGTRQPLQEPQQSKPEDKKDNKSEVKPKPKVEQPNQGPNVGNITQGPCK